MTDPEIELCGCEHCDKAFPIEDMTMMGECWMCESCIDEWQAVFKACSHSWEPAIEDGEDGKYCEKCCGFVADRDFTSLFPSPQEGAAPHD